MEVFIRDEDKDYTFTIKENKYFDYILEHINNVKKGFELLLENFSELFDNMSSEELKQLRIQLRNHDLSKYSNEEFDAYCNYFYGDDKTEEIKNAFDYAWLHHQHNNPHHHQYWLLKQDDGQFKALDMPYNYIIEMICDWWAFSIKKGDLQEIQNWYSKNKDKMILSDNTRTKVEFILNKLTELKGE